ncbi:MAG: hypothetical protein ACRBM6_21075 [Geminicoccales bacterium]
MFIPGLNPVADAINRAKEAVAPVTSPVKERFDNAFDKVKSGVGAVSEVAEAATDGDGARPLNAEEINAARQVFGDSIDYDKVQINESSPPAIANKHVPGNDKSRPFAVGNTIYYPSEIDLNNPIEHSTFLHEVTHVWQFQSTKGAGTTVEGAWLATKNQREVYRLDNVDIDPSNSETFHNLDIEQQAEIVRGHYLLSEHEALTIEKGNLEKVVGNSYVGADQQNNARSRIAEIDSDLSIIRNHGRFDDLSTHKDTPIDPATGDHIGFTASDLEPFVDEIRGTRPREGIAAEGDEAFDEISGELLRGNPIGAQREYIEGTVEIGREVGEVVLQESGEAIIAGTEKAEETFSDIKDLVTGRRFPFG